MRSLTVAAAAVAIFTTESKSQTIDFSHPTTRPVQAVRASQPPNSSGSFIVEALGGSIGSLIGAGGIALAKCHGDDLGCSAIRVGAEATAGAIGATIGASLAAHHTGSRRSVIGAALGTVVGTGVGLGVLYAFNHDSDRNLSDGATVPVFAISQGTIAAIGSRLLGR